LIALLIVLFKIVSRHYVSLSGSEAEASKAPSNKSHPGEETSTSLTDLTSTSSRVASAERHKTSTGATQDSSCHGKLCAARLL